MGVLEFRCVTGREGAIQGTGTGWWPIEVWKVVRATLNQTYTRAALQMVRFNEHESEGSLWWCLAWHARK